MKQDPTIASTSSVASRIYANAGNLDVLRLVPPSARRVLDVGCGAGDNAAALASKGVVVDGITLSQAEASVAGKHCREVFIHNLEQGLPEGISDAYDCAICSHVLEHLCWPEALLQALRNVLLPQAGTLIVALPNPLYYTNRSRLLLGRLEYESSGLMDNTHFRWYSFRSGAALLRRNGFFVEAASAQGTAPLWWLRRVLGRTFAAKIDAAATALSPGLFGYQLLYVARPV